MTQKLLIIGIVCIGAYLVYDATREQRRIARRYREMTRQHTCPTSSTVEVEDMLEQMWSRNDE